FFQAEDGIRDRNVTGVQTCALPIYRLLISLSFILIVLEGFFYKFTKKYSDHIFNKNEIFFSYLIESIISLMAYRFYSRYEFIRYHLFAVFIFNHLNLFFYIELGIICNI